MRNSIGNVDTMDGAMQMKSDLVDPTKPASHFCSFNEPFPLLLNIPKGFINRGGGVSNRGKGLVNEPNLS